MYAFAIACLTWCRTKRMEGEHPNGVHSHVDYCNSCACREGMAWNRGMVTLAQEMFTNQATFSSVQPMKIMNMILGINMGKSIAQKRQERK